MESEALIKKGIEIILDRKLTDGGFSQRPHGGFRPDVTAWAILALSTQKNFNNEIARACIRIAGNQRPDGRIILMEGLDSAWWPSPLAVMAWKKSDGLDSRISSAVAFMLNSSGLHFPKEKNSPTGHNPAIRGWSWSENTHSWIEPTGVTILALRTVGYSQNDRVHEAVRMILDRQIPSGGWNYGNTTVFQKELLPMPDQTGIALCALAGIVKRSNVQKSIELAAKEIACLISPLSLCWSLFGLRAWGLTIPDAQKFVLKSISLQEKFGLYDTEEIAKLIVAYETKGDLLNFLGVV